MSEIPFQKTWFTGNTSCSICLLYYTKKKPVNLHDATALQTHLDGSLHRTAVTQLLVKHSTHAKLKAAALGVKARKGVKINLPVNNNNFWKYAFLQKSTQLSAPSTSTTAAVSAATTATTSTTTSHSKKRQRTSEEPSVSQSTASSSIATSSSSSHTVEALSYMFVKQQQQLDEHSKQLAQLQTTLSSINTMLTDVPALIQTAAHPILHSTAPDTTAVADEVDAEDDDDALRSGLDEHDTDSDNESQPDATPTSSTAPQRSASMPTASTRRKGMTKRRRLSDRRGASPPSKNTRTHS
jgi:hypothetical protein